MSTSQHSSAPPGSATIMRPPQGSRVFLTAFWLVITAGLIWLLWHVSQRPGEKTSDMICASGFFGVFWLFVTVVIFRQVTLEIELGDDTIAVSSLFQRRRQLPLDQIEYAHYLTANKGPTTLRLAPVDRMNKPISFPIDILTPADAGRIKAFVSEKDHAPRHNPAIARRFSVRRFILINILISVALAWVAYLSLHHHHRH